MANWQQFSDLWNQGSFVSQVPAPNADPAAEPTVCVQFNGAWLPYVLGAIFQLTQPSAWDPASAGFADVLSQAQALMAIFSEGGTCVGMLEFRCDPDTGTPQYSIDGGVTWIDLPDCFIGPAGPAGPTGPTGPAGGFTPGTPPIQPGQTTDELACSVAGYLASEIIQQVVTTAISHINGGETILQTVTAIVALVPEFNVVAAPIFGAAALLYNTLESGNLSEWEFAETDPTLWDDVTCAIYGATSGDGYVTDANFAAVVAAIGAITYTYPDVIGGLVDFLNAGGAVVLEAAQIPGALAVIDCSGCGGPGLDNALEFDASGAQTLATLASDLVIGSAFTFGGWVHGNAGGSIVRLMVAGYTGANALWETFIDSGSHAGALVQNAAGSSASVGSTSLVGSGNTHIAFVYDGTQIHLYLDGVQVAGALTPTPPFNTSGGASAFGGFPGGGNANIQMWRWYAWNSALTPTQVAAWHALGTFGTPAVSPAHAWLFSEGSGTTVADTAGGNDATISGPVHWTTHT